MRVKVKPGALVIAVDTGGTFTDLVAAELDGGVIAALKDPTEPEDPASSFVRGIKALLRKIDRKPRDIARLVHGTTIATNLVLERKGARVAFVGTRGFEQVPLIGRETRGGTSVFDLRFQKPDPLIVSGAAYGVGGRIAADGGEVEPFDSTTADAAIERIRAQSIDSVAVCFMHSYANPSHERWFAERMKGARPNCYIALSSEISPEFREYDRAMTTIISAYVGPGLEAYLTRLEGQLLNLGVTAELEVMQSHGGVSRTRDVIRRAVSVLESGPAAGVLASSRIGQMVDSRNIISFDMGGTTAKAGVVLDGAPVVSREFTVGGSASGKQRFDGRGLPVRSPVIDLAEVGAGGGSIARVDRWGVLKVGPRSAAARPGPACYGRGGSLPTITDADLVLGYLRAGGKMGGDVYLSRERAEEAVRAHVAEPLGVDLACAARGIVDVANASMASAIRLVTIARGIDPRSFTLIGFGGAGPSHIVALADEFSIPRIVIPQYAGVMSALGLASADVIYEAVTTKIGLLEDIDKVDLIRELDSLAASAKETVLSYGIDVDRLSVTRAADLRYYHQAHELAVSVDRNIASTDVKSELERAFRRDYLRRYGTSSDDPVEIVNLRVQILGRMPKCRYIEGPVLNRHAAKVDERTVYFDQSGSLCAVYRTRDLGRDSVIAGPAIIEDEYSSLALPPTWVVRVDRWGNLIVEKQ